MTELTTATVMAEYANMPLMIPASQLINMWDLGCLNEASYVFLALRLEKVGEESESFDVEAFCERWEAPPSESGKIKRPKGKTVLSVLEKLQDIGMGEIEQTRIQLRLDFGGML